ncbi:hypothetical protein SLS56_000323 [Neofusicoccum ribis]|uniref:Protein kinase domain-containing protein n=1 Tax=Neofusicoccum ribis TaxID=45134 RepID=A0ABR3TE06_9PEZI
MADVAFGAITALKEVYLVSKFIAKTARSAARHRTERSAILSELEYEHLYIRSFGLLFFQRNGVLVSNSDLNREWVEKIAWVLNELRLAFGDYTRLAAEQDAEYQQSSPFLNGPDIHGQIDFEADSALSQDDHDSSGTVTPADGKKPRKFSDLDWRWALRDKRKLQQVLAGSQKWTSKLKELVQLSMAVNPRFTPLSASPLSDSSINMNEDALQLLGLSTHMRLRQINLDPRTTAQPVELDSNTTLELPTQLTTLSLAQMIENDNICDVLVEVKEVAEQVQVEEEDRVRQLAQLLRLSGTSDLSTLPFRGYSNHGSENKYIFVYDFPDGVQKTAPTTLLETVSRPREVLPGLSLPLRFKIAQSIANSLAALHADKWVHKSFRSGSIVFFKDSDSNVDYSSPYLVNFEYSRAASAATAWTSDEDVMKNLYRHPDRQRPPQRSFNQIHDLYALGIVLLEIGTWSPISAIRHRLQERLGQNTFLSPENLAECYTEIASRDLPHTMGPSYAEAVATCLRGQFSVPVTDPDFALRVYDLVLRKLDISSLLQ